MLLSIADVRVAVPAGNGIEAGLVVLEEGLDPHRRLQMFVGQPEARAIHVSWSNVVPPRPSTWDLFVSTIALLDARIERVIITDVQEERHYFAQVVIYRAGEVTPLLLTARPSDAIALALRTYGARIYARPHVLDEAGVLGDGSHWVRPSPEPAEPEPKPEWDLEFGPDPAPEPGSEPGSDSEPGDAPGVSPAPDGAEAADGPAPDGGPDLEASYEGMVALAGPVGTRRAPPPDPVAREQAAAERAAAARSARSFGERTSRGEPTP